MDAFDEVGLDVLVLDARRQVDRDQAGPGARGDHAEIGPADGLGADARGALEQPPRPDSGARWCSAASSLNRFRSEALARLSVPMAMRAPEAKKRDDRRAADADPEVAARAGHDGRPRRGEPGQFGVRALDAVHGEQRRADEAEAIEILDRPARRRRPARIPGAAGVEHVAPAAAAGVQELDLVRRFADVDAEDRAGVCAARRPSRRSTSGDTE